jgi:hypothetical protein
MYSRATHEHFLGARGATAGAEHLKGARGELLWDGIATLRTVGTPWPLSSGSELRDLCHLPTSFKPLERGSASGAPMTARRMNRWTRSAAAA